MATDKLVTDFFEAWNAGSRDDRHKGLSAVLADTLVYADPHLPEIQVGRDAYLAFTDTFRGKFPDLVFVSAGAQSHHGFLQMTWTLKRTDGSTFSSGRFFVDLTQDGRIARLVGFMA